MEQNKGNSSGPPEPVQEVASGATWTTDSWLGVCKPLFRRRMMKDSTILLVHPPQRGLLEGFSSGLISLANFLRLKEPELDVQLLDYGLTPGHELPIEVQKACRQARSRLFVGITTTTASYQSALAVLRVFQAVRPDCVRILGGHHVSAQDEVVLRHHADLVRLVVRGEGEVPLLQLLRNYPELGEVPGISYRDRFGMLQPNREAPLLQEEDLDAIPPTILGTGLRSAPGKFDHATYVSARGCPLLCSFCSVGRRMIRTKSVGAVIKDLRYLVGDLGYRRIAIEDNFFAHKPKRTLDLCRSIAELRREIEFSWDCQTRVESLQDPQIVEALKGAGCEAVYLGVESVLPEFLAYLGKTTTPDHYVSALKHRVIPMLTDSGIAVYLNLQTAIPGETDDHRQRTLTFMRDLGVTASKRGQSITVFPQVHVIYPGTRHYSEAYSRGLFGPLGEDVFEAFTVWEVTQEPILRWLGRHFAHGVGGIPIGILDLDELRLNGRFRIDASRVAATSDFLDDLAALPSIEVFEYLAYLTPDACGTNTAVGDLVA